MDITIKRTYYYLRLINDGKYHLFARDEVIGPRISIQQLGGAYEVEADVALVADHLNKEAECKQVRI